MKRFLTAFVLLCCGAALGAGVGDYYSAARVHRIHAECPEDQALPCTLQRVTIRYPTPAALDEGAVVLVSNAASLRTVPRSAVAALYAASSPIP